MIILTPVFNPVGSSTGRSLLEIIFGFVGLIHSGSTHKSSDGPAEWVLGRTMKVVGSSFVMVGLCSLWP